MRLLSSRTNFKALWLVTFIFCGLSVTFWTRQCPEETQRTPVARGDRDYYDSDKPNPDDLPAIHAPPHHLSILTADSEQLNSNLANSDLANSNLGPGRQKYQPMECLINDEYSIECRRENDEVYVPFSFLEKYFEVSGRLAEYDGYDRFEWQHSYSKIYQPRGPYSPTGIFMSFENYNVEIRDRVKAISGLEGVPVSTQWGPDPYFYPIQIAQFGLSHYSKNLTEKEPRVTVFERGDGQVRARWESPGKLSQVESVSDKGCGCRVLQFSTDALPPGSGPTLMLGATSDQILSFHIKFSPSAVVSNVSVVVDTSYKKQYILHYTSSKELISARGTNIYYGLGPRADWSLVTRDLLCDLRKGVGLSNSKSVKKTKITIKRVSKVVLQGKGRISNITMATSSHIPQFFDAADWFVRNQDDGGGWPINVVRKLVDGMQELPPGWYSAMAQGQAMSTLTRAFGRTSDRRYLDAALRGTRPFRVPSENGGVLAVFMDRHRWYEEYPTTPSSFVLNGFIYSLIGLYDLQQAAPPGEGKEAAELFAEGMRSLKAMLPLYDTGAGTVYDLRHFMLGIAPNIARWDYHTTHVNLLQLLVSIDPDPVLAGTLRRWVGYTKGRRAKHN
ncbi:D-glucuronyl C5-epimerase B-like [Branchiostoma lanceolatum]|uniref:D-glucuronyl C5-epimerase B-like n=1 Tax=Branchiostoma lanceolatum TaxID=7740 RepID=UPI00345632A8